jgi:hypothetical protein
VLGFRGCEHVGDGHYQILASQSHAWVEVLVSRPGPDGTTQHWLVLDPTPSSDEVPRPSFSLARWWEAHRNDPAILWREYILDYDPGRQGAALLGPLADSLRHSAQRCAMAGRAC